MNERDSYNLILLGGTGAKCGEIFIHMCANGYFTGKSVNILYIDSDTKNGNARDFKNLIEIYNRCRERYLIAESPIPCFFKPIINFHDENPVKGFTYFKDMGDSGGGNYVTQSVKALMKTLYSQEELDMEISEGFFAHPNVGAAVLAANIDRIMKWLMDDIEKDKKDMKKIHIFLLGSIFGGTGASSLPTITKYLKEQLVGASDNKQVQEQIKIGGCMILPYFSFTRQNMDVLKEKERIDVEAGKFATKTKAALEYYKYMDEESGRRIFDDLYVIGHDGNDVRGVFATAGEKQKNLPHIVEMYAAMAATAFFESPMLERGYYFAVVSSEKIGWWDIYKTNDGLFSFFVMMRFAFVMKSMILEELFDYVQENKLKKYARRIPWYYDFLEGKDESSDMDSEKLFDLFKDISLYCDEYIRWFTELNVADISKLSCLDRVRYDDKDDVVMYLSMFTKELLFRQHQNNQISAKNTDMKEEEAANVYEDNLKYIRKNFQFLEMVHSYTDLETEKIKLSDIWSRLCDVGLNRSVLDEDVFKNISNSSDKTMKSGVKNLVNAAFCACLF